MYYIFFGFHLMKINRFLCTLSVGGLAVLHEDRSKARDQHANDPHHSVPQSLLACLRTWASLPDILIF